MELLATTHWVAQHGADALSDDQAIISAVQAWSRRKRERFAPNHIRKAAERLRNERWLPAAN